MNSRKKIIVTGASGFLGSHLVERLKDDGKYAVYALSSRPDELKEKIGGENAAYLHRDAVLEPGTGKLLDNAIVVNCAYPRNSTGTAVADGLKYIQKVFESAAENHAAAVINISSQSVYSQQRTEPASEKDPVSLESTYAVGKYASELMLESICGRAGTHCTNLRMASLIGPGFEQRIVNRLVKQAAQDHSLSVKRNDQRFGFFDVEDAVSGLAAMLDSEPEKWKPVYNFGRNGAYTLAEIAEAVKETVERFTGTEVRIETADGEERTNTELSADLFRQDFKFQERCSLRDTIERIFTYNLKNKS